MRQESLIQKSSLALLCLGILAASLLTAGCSKAEKKAAPEEKKKVVTEMNIQPSSSSEETAPPKENEVESLPFESSDSKDEELPVLGSGG